jgi:hypothetical protein
MRIIPYTSIDYQRIEKVDPKRHRHESPRYGSWWIDQYRGEPRLFMTCNICGHIIILTTDYRVHPKGYLQPCVMCPDCDDEAYRFLNDWVPVKAFTTKEDWKDRTKLLGKDYETSIY